MRLCVILIISCSLLPLQAAELALSIDYRSTGKSLNQVLEHFRHIADLQSDIDAVLIQEGVLETPIHIHLQQANEIMCLEAITHAIQQQSWWHLEQKQFSLSRSLHKNNNVRVSSRLYQSNMPFAAESHAFIKHALAAHLCAPKSGFGFIQSQRQWSAVLDERGHQALQHLIRIFERGHSSIPITRNPTLKRVLTVSNDIRCNDWPSAIQALGKQLKCCISLAQELNQVAQDIHIPPCTAEQLIDHLSQLGVTAQWINHVLCIGGQAYTRQHPLHSVSVWLPLTAYQVEEQERICAALKRCCHEAYWRQSGCCLLHIPQRHACLIQAHPAAIAAILQRFALIDQRQQRP